MNSIIKPVTRNYLLLVAFNLLVILGFVFLAVNCVAKPVTPVVQPEVARKISALVYRVRSMPTFRRERVLNILNLPHWEISLTSEPKFPKSAIVLVTSENILRKMEASTAVELSLSVTEDSWINLSQKKYRGFGYNFLLIVSASFLIIFFLGNYWLVRRLNVSTKTLLQSLEFACEQKNWSPLPIVGDDDQKRVYELINNLHAKSEQLMKNRSHMLAAISHDLRTPLTRLKLRVENLEEDVKFAKMMNDVHAMEVMIWETLDYFSEYNRELQKAKFDLQALLNTIIEEEQDKQHDVSLIYPESKITYFANINLLKRAFENVIHNAIQHASQVRVIVKDAVDYILISVEDNGNGISEEDLSKLGNPYFQADNSRTTGTGLGLMIAKEVVLLHGGSIEFAKQMQGGLRVDIKLPKVK